VRTTGEMSFPNSVENPSSTPNLSRDAEASGYSKMRQATLKKKEEKNLHSKLKMDDSLKSLKYD